MIEDFPVVK